jgi:hypothetical protein
MSTVPETQQPVPSSTLRRLMAHHPVAAFLVMAYTLGWTSSSPRSSPACRSGLSALSR